MSEILSKTSLFTIFNHHHHNDNDNKISLIDKNNKNAVSFCSSSLNVKPKCLRASSDFLGNKVVVRWTPRRENHPTLTINTQMNLRIGKVQKWWEKGMQPNMKEVTSAQDLVDSLLNAGDKLVVVDFYSPGCGGCKALHPKICQLAEMNPDVQFLQVNYEIHKSMCYSLNVHVLPFFSFYRGAEGRVCRFSCTNATIKKFKDALAKHAPDRCSIGPTKGLEEKELLALAANIDISFKYVPETARTLPAPAQKNLGTKVASPNSGNELFDPLPSTVLNSAKDFEDKVVAER